VIGVVAALAGAPLAQAAPVTTADFEYYRNGDLATGGVDLQQGENGYASFSATIGPEWSGWAFPKKKKFTFTSSDIDVMDATNDEMLFGWVFWQGTSSTDPDCYKSAYFTLKFVVPQRSCVDTVSYVAEVFADTADSDIEIESDLLEASFAGNSREATPEDGLSYDIYAAVRVEDATSLEIDTSEISDVTVETGMCVNESLIDNGDEATRQFEVKFDGTPIAESASNTESWVNWQWTPEDQPVTLEGDEPLQNLTDQAGGWVTTANEGVVTVTVSTDLRVDGSSVLEPCEQAFAGPLSTSATGANPGATDSTMDLPTAFEWRDGSTPAMVRDGFGGIFAVDSVFDETDGITTTNVTHLGSSGDNDDFAGDGVVTLETATEFPEVIRWNTGGSSWALSDFDYEAEVLTVRSGSMSSSSTRTVTVDYSVLEESCNRPGAWVEGVRMISAPTDSPLIRIDCYYRASKKNPFASVTALALVDMTQDDTLVGAGGFPSSSMTGAGLNVLSVAVNPDATGDETAVFVYSQSSTVKKRGTEIRLNSIEPDGTVNYVSVPTNPFGKKEINSLELVPGVSEGTWLGVVDQSYVRKNEYVVNQHLVRVTAGDYVTLGNSVDLGYDVIADIWDYSLVPLGSDTEFGQMSFARSMFDNEAIGNVDLNIWNVTTGDMATGESVPTVDPTHGYEPLLWSSPGAGDPTFFWITSESQYQVVTWNLP
jgi:hypothetical protein